MQKSLNRDLREQVGSFMVPIGRTVEGVVLGVVPAGRWKRPLGIMAYNGPKYRSEVSPS